MTQQNKYKQITIDGDVFNLVPAEDQEDSKTPDCTLVRVLNSYQDCLDHLSPKWYLDDGGVILESFHRRDPNQVPTEKNAKQILAACKLFVICAALNGEWEPDWGNDNELKYYVSYQYGDLTTSSFWSMLHAPYIFKTEELAQKSIDIAKDIWLSYFGVENK